MTLSGFPFQELHFHQQGMRDPGTAPVDIQGATDLIVIAHGWKNDRLDATALYEGLLRGIRSSAGEDLLRDGRSWRVAGVFWPALLFRPDLTLVRGTADEDSGGGAGLAADVLPEEELAALARSIAAELDAGEPDAMAVAAVAGSGGGGAADDFIAAFRSLLSTDADAEAAGEHEALLGDPGRELVAAESEGGNLELPDYDASPPPEPSGQGASFKEVRNVAARIRSGGAAAIARLLNQGTYFEMKARAGRVGAGLATMLAAEVPAGVRIHLIGHSFGARLVTAACAAQGAHQTRTLCLLQGAFSHNALGTAFGQNRAVTGAFRNVVEEGRVAGATLITHTHRDSAVGLLYALASSASGVIASAHGLERLIGGPDDPHGGMGANGALSMLEGEALAAKATGEELPKIVAGKVNNVLCDAIIHDHNDVANAQVAALVWQAIGNRTD